MKPDQFAKIVEKAAAVAVRVQESQGLHWQKRQEHHATRKPNAQADRAPASLTATPIGIPNPDRRRMAESITATTGAIRVALPKTPTPIE